MAVVCCAAESSACVCVRRREGREKRLKMKQEGVHALPRMTEGNGDPNSTANII